jgi:hypothetical protein
MKISKDLTLAELAALIATELKKLNIECVLTGGAVVSIYTDNKYQSSDLDYISPNDQKEIEQAVAKLGFIKEGRIFTHPNTAFYVEFPKGPLSIGNQLIKAEGELTISGNKLILLSPTQSVMDRLAAFYHWNDRQSLDQAVWISEKHPINFAKVKAWSKNEGALDKYEEFFSLTSKK